MNRVSPVRVVALILLVVVTAAGQQEQQPYRSRGTQPLEYNGSGRNDPEPAGLTEVRLGFFGPQGSGQSRGELIWQGANLAIEEANQAGGYRGIPFRLVPVWTGNPWAGGAAKLIRGIYEENLWAIIGGIDSSTTHLAEQVVAKTQLVLMNPAATDRTVHAANVPWMFSCVPGDHAIAPLISRELKHRKLPFVLVSSTDHDFRAFTTELKRAFAQDQISPSVHIEFNPTSLRASDIGQQTIRSSAGAVVVAATADQSAEIINAVRAAGYEGAIFAGPWFARVPPSPGTPKDIFVAEVGEISPTFRGDFVRRYGHEPDYTAAHAYDAANVLVAAIRRSGLNRARILDAVRANSPYQGVTGTIDWDVLGQNRRAPKLVKFGGPPDEP